MHYSRVLQFIGLCSSYGRGFFEICEACSSLKTNQKNKRFFDANKCGVNPGYVVQKGDEFLGGLLMDFYLCLVQTHRLITV